ncbi:MAG: cobalt ECF transporter T component CbiQ [Syntrophomonadaceae bacterium]|jgi:cobalt/nickel transport system permease protein|nr:cobalt ECF transporter T component CbiQ [Syntrophomonadaceae bacterium]
MPNIQNSVQNIYTLENLAAGGTVIHRLHPAAKMLSALFFIVTVVSFDRYAVLSLTPFVFYPAVLMALSETPHLMMFKRFFAALPFCLFAGIANVIFERSAAFSLGGLTVSFGTISLITLLFRTYLCVMAVLILIATTPVMEITGQLRRVRVPAIFVTLFEMTYRYTGVLLEEAAFMHTAYSLRGRSQKGIEMRHMGSFVGQLIIRSFDRAERVYAAMKCRGYALREFHARERKFTARDMVFAAMVFSFCVFFRMVSIDAVINALARF